MNLQTFTMRALAPAIVVALGAFASAQRQPVEQLVGKPMPAFRMTDLNGKVHTNQSLRGKVVLLDFWATWCGPCKAAKPTMSSLHRQFGPQGLVVVGANLDEPKDVVKRYLDKNKLTYAFTLNNSALTDRLGILGLPVFIVIDRRGVVRKVETGWSAASPASFERTIRGLLARR